MTIDRLAGLPDDTSVTPNPARMYDYILGGNHNTEADRIAAERARAIYPDMPLVFRANRAFLRRAILYLIEQGIDQFLDVGSGIPTVGNVHEIAQYANPDAHVVYVDVDPVATALSAAVLGGNAQATVIQADARDPAAILAHPETRRLLDFDRPVALLLVSMLLFVPDDGGDGSGAHIPQRARAGQLCGALPPRFRGRHARGGGAGRGGLRAHRPPRPQPPPRAGRGLLRGLRGGRAGHRLAALVAPRGYRRLR